MKLSRRDFLKIGGVTLITIAGGSVLRAVDQGVLSVGQGVAYEPWTNWRGAATATERIVAAGILASNPHNSQPWIFRITDSTIDLYADRERQIGAIDPFLREMYIGLGCALENMMLSAEAEGFSATPQLMPNPADETHAAHIELEQTSAATSLSCRGKVAKNSHFPPTVLCGRGTSTIPSDLYSAIPNRHTDRGAYDTARSIAPETFDEIESLITEADLHLFWFKDDASHAQFSKVAIESAEALVADEQQSMDSHLWWRHHWDQLQQTADGLTLDAQALGPVITPIAKILPDLSRQQNDAAFVKNVREIMLPTAAAFGILAVRDGMDNSQRLNCGHIWQRIHLWGTLQGLAMQPLNQMCERVDREIQVGSEPVIGNAVRALVNDDSWHAIMPFRLGYPTQKVNASPRRGLGKVIE